MQVSADELVSLPPERAALVTATVPMGRPWLPPHVHDARLRWRFDPEDEGTLVVLTMQYAAGPGWVRVVLHEPTQWWLRRGVRRRVRAVADACRAASRARSR